MKRVEGDTYELSTGRRLYANRGIIGWNGEVDDEDGEVVLYEGYDGSLTYERLTIAERLEIAEHMAQQWAEYATSLRTRL